MEWKKARKKPIVIEFREVKPNEVLTVRPEDGDEYTVHGECIETREGFLFGFPEQDFIIRGVEGEIYPIKKEIFKKTYDVIEDNE